MKKKSIIALLLACSFAFGAATFTGCNIIGGDSSDGGDQNQTEGGDKNDNTQTPDDNKGDNTQKPGDSTGDDGNQTQKPGDSTGDDGNQTQKPGDGNDGDDTDTDPKPPVTDPDDGDKDPGDGEEKPPVTDPDVPVVERTVKFYNEGVLVETRTVKDGEKVTAPNVSKTGYSLTGWATSSASGTIYDFDQGVTSDLNLYAKWAPVSDKVSYLYAGNECAAFEWADNNPDGATVQYKLSTASSYSNVDAQLVRASATAGTARVDVVGLKGGENYDFKITPSNGSAFTISNIAISAYDRSGYAHFGKTDGVGAYKDDGTPKDNAVIVYVNESNKNSVTANGQTGLVKILQNAGTSKPLIVRIIGTVGAATWNKLIENNDKALTPDKVLGKDGTKLIDKYGITVGTSKSTDIKQETLISDGMNTLNYYPEEYDGNRCEELLGLSSKIKYDSSKKEFDSCWNDCSISGVKNVTVEGIGEDARIFQWGMTFKNSSSIEVRNLKFEDYTEDACSFEGSETSASSLSSFNSGNIWVHHNTFEEGMNYWDVCNEQDKHDGDGSTDFKGLKNITLSYNVYNGTHKTGLIGGSNSQTTANVTFHHNAYNNCKARLPLARQANMHMYNNYYNGTTSCDLSLRANAYAFVENCYFESGNNRPVELRYELVKDSSGKVTGNRYGAAKLVDCIVTESKISVASEIDKDKSLYVGNDREAKVTHVNAFGHDFDTNSTLFYYDSVNKKSKVTVMFTAEETKELVPKLAGVQKRGGDVTLGGSGDGTETHKHTYSESYTSAGASGHYKMATCEHTTEHTAIEPHVYSDNNDTTCNLCDYVRTIGGSTETSVVVLDPSSLAAASITADAPVTSGIFKLVGGTSFAVTSESREFTYNGKKYTTTNRISLGGSANFSSSRYIEFTTTGACKITVAALSSGSNVRTLNLVNATNTGNVIATFGAPANSSDLGVNSFDCTEAGTFRLGSAGSGINVYYIIIEYV